LRRVSYYCVFCEIIARREPARIEYEDDDVVVFHNVLNWVPVMLLSVPRQHLTQGELWTSPLLEKVGSAAAEQGARLCPGGFRLLSNFGRDAMQSQAHAHVHVIGGTFLGEYA
jgi:histidine triad (HIT) family protein